VSPNDCDVVLRDGTTVHLRPLAASDATALDRFYAGLSEDSVQFRFFGQGGGRRALQRLLSADGSTEFALIAECSGTIVALAQYARDTKDASRAEAAFLVADAMQGRGIGTRLLEQLAEHARERGVSTFHADVLGSNSRMLQVFVDSGFDVRSRTEHGVIEVVFPLAETAAFAERVAQRATVAARASLHPFFEPASVAVVGAKRSHAGVGAAILENLRTTGFAGRIVPIHPAAHELQGLAAFQRLTDVPGAVDLVVIVVPAVAVESVVRDAIAKGVKALVVISAGFAETGATGRRLEEDLLALVRSAGVRMIGPNCMGLLNADPAVMLNATFAPVFPPSGHVAFSTQSGALGLAILEYAKRVNLGLSTFASIGNKADVSSNDLIQYWSDDPQTRVILLYLESFGNPRKFAQLARDVGRRKPIVAVKAGRSRAGARAASSHTGALAASDTIVDALFRHAGVIRTTTLEEMFDIAMLLDRQPLPAGPRVAVLTNAGGPGILAADACEAHRLQVAALHDSSLTQLRSFLPAAAGLHNPVDMLATATAGHYERAMRLLLADPNVDSLLTIFIPPLVTAATDVAAAMTRVAREATKPVVATFMSVEGATALLSPIPCYRFPEAAVAALARATAYAAWRRQPPGTVPDFTTEVARAAPLLTTALSRGGGWMAPLEAQQVLESLGVPVVASRLVRDADDAVAAADVIGYPVALKGTGPSILHKSDVGAVKLGVPDHNELRRSVEELANRLGAKLTSLLVQQMAGEGVEMFVGGIQDPTFGPVIFCGSGGVLVELFGDAVCRLCPLSDRDAAEMVSEIRGVARLRGHRGRPASDEGALRDVLLRIAALLEAHPEIREMDVNPLIVRPQGIVAVDVRIRLDAPVMQRVSRRVRY
jgi:acetyl coenzyme A synthetase (ADP forming)-like protein